jgi:hypothetical protein
MFKLVSTEPLICSTEVHIKDSAGDYVKSVCEVRLLYKYEQARTKCLEYGAQLFKDTSQDELNAVAAHADCMFGSGHVWIDGRIGDSFAFLYGEFGSNFFKTPITRIRGYYFYCEYKRTDIVKPVPSEFKLIQVNQ